MTKAYHIMKQGEYGRDLLCLEEMHFGERDLGCRLETRKQSFLRRREETFNNFRTKAADSQGVNGKEQRFELVRKLMMSTSVLPSSLPKWDSCRTRMNGLTSLQKSLYNLLLSSARPILQQRSGYIKLLYEYTSTELSWIYLPSIIQNMFL